jgi:chromosomal replication initiation ATPase DnaA
MSNTEIDYIILYGKARRKIKALELQLDRIINRHNHEIQQLKSELLKPSIKRLYKDKSQINKLLLVVCDVTGTTAGQLIGGGRERHIVLARHLFFYIGRNDYNISWSKLSGLLDMNHTSAMHGAAQYEIYLKYNYQLEQKMYNQVKKLMEAEQ